MSPISAWLVSVFLALGLVFTPHLFAVEPDHSESLSQPIAGTFNLINQDGSPDQRLSGDLEIAGFETNGDIDAGAGGQLSAVSVDSEILSSDVNLDLEGAVRTDVVSGDTIYGVVTGDARGDFNLDIDGRFYGDRR